MRSFYSPLILLVVALLSGCELMSPSGPYYTAIPQPQPSKGKALVYVYRTANGRWVGRVHISVDGKPMAEVGDWEYSWCQVAPGEHSFQAEWGIMDKPMFEGGQFDTKTTVLKVEPGKTYCICYTIRDDGEKPGVLESSGLLGKAMSKSHVVSVTFDPEDIGGAVGSIGVCKYRESHLAN